MPPSKKKPGVEDWRWGAFWKGGFYGNNKTHKEARCRGEVALEEAKLKEEQADKIRCGALQPGHALPGDKLHQLALDAVKPFCGKIKYLTNHIRDCDSVQAKWKQKLEAENDGSDSDNSATPATATTSQAVVKKRQATFEKWVPGVDIPGRDALSGRILDAEVLSIEAGWKSEMKDELATGSVDGWSTLGYSNSVTTPLSPRRSLHNTWTIMMGGRYTSEKMALKEFKNMFNNQDTVVLMNAIWRGVKGELAQMALRILAMIANSGGNERAFSVLGRTYSDKTRNLLNPERAHKSLIVQRDIVESFPSSKQRRRRHIPFVQLRADLKSGADNIIPDDDQDPANGNITELARCLNELPEDGDAGDDNSPEPEIVQAILRPSIRLHFGTEELYDLDKIFAEASINTVST
ncbi:hypothetical protein B0H10DRAFT_2200182 [Mycena sp. CBHHK59/15]|nr:hypothetical protein B0H10DRAFT_2200182 [Mycena sp. CBHHK59/15]